MSEIAVTVDGTVTSVTVDGVSYLAAVAAPAEEVIKETTVAPAGDELPAKGAPAKVPAATGTEATGDDAAAGDGDAAKAGGDKTVGEPAPTETQT